MSTLSWRFDPPAKIALSLGMCVSQSANTSYFADLDLLREASVVSWPNRLPSVHPSICESSVLTCIENVTVPFGIKETHFRLCVGLLEISVSCTV